MKYNLLGLMAILLPLVVKASENSEYFAEYNENKNTLFISNVEIIGSGGLHYNRAFLHLAIDGSWEVLRLTDPVSNDLPELKLINRYDSNSHTLSMPLVEVNDTERYKNVKIQLGEKWQVIEIEEYDCHFTEQQANELQLCSTIDELEKIVGCSGVLMESNFLGENNYKWPNLSIDTKVLDSGIEQVFGIQSFKYNLSIFSGC